MLPSEQCTRVRALNDRMRQYLTGGRVQLTSGIRGLGDHAVRQALLAVAAFDNFGPSNDPYGEHDFGAFTIAERQLFWKIDYYAPGFESAALDPGDETVCVRVLTIMLAEEY